MTTIVRETRETSVRVEIGDTGAAPLITTTIPFLDHMLGTLSRYSGLPLRVSATGDLSHHISEDVAIALGASIAAHAASGIARYGDRTVPMDDALVQCCLDLGGRSYYRGPLPSVRYEHWMRSFAENARATVHLRVLRGRDRHHIVEAAFKSLGFALRDALAAAPDGATFSTKGRVALDIAQ
jgi:imidazoleglycerol-phosphate dehydratase